MRITDYFSAIGREPSKAFMAGWLNVLYCVGILFLVEFASYSDTAKAFFTVFACLPIVISIWIVSVAFVWPLYNKVRDDEKSLNPFSYVFTWLSKAVSVSMIYLIFWVWHKDSFELLPTGIGAFHAWGWVLAAAFDTSAGTATFGSGDQGNVFLALIANFDVIISMMSHILFFGLTVAMRRNLLETLPSKPISHRRYSSKYSDEEEE